MNSEAVPLRVAVLSDEVAGVAGQHDVVDFALAAGPEIDHFPDIGKMVGNHVAGDFARRFGLGHDVEKVVPLRVTQQVLKIAREPVFDARFRLLGMAFESVGQFVNQFGFHRNSVS